MATYLIGLCSTIDPARSAQSFTASLRRLRRCFSHFLQLSRCRGDPPQRVGLPVSFRHGIGALSESWAMTTFDKREEAFEKKFAIDAEQRFKAVARRNRLLGLWVANRLGITGDAAGAYAKEVIASEFDGTGDDGVISKVSGDL